MIKKLAWNTFKNTGNIDSYLELIELENVEKNIEKNKENYGDSKDQGDSNFRK